MFADKLEPRLNGWGGETLKQHGDPGNESLEVKIISTNSTTEREELRCSEIEVMLFDHKAGVQDSSESSPGR